MKPPTRLLMCAPDHFAVDYVINPWMEGNVHKATAALAAAQWRSLVKALEPHASIEFVEPQPGLPDMVFTANAGIVLGSTVVLSHFLHRERQPEERHFRTWFEGHGFRVRELPRDLPFEGAGDALPQCDGRWLWAGYGSRSELDAHPLLAGWLGLEIVSLRLVDRRFYHLDTCLCPLDDGWLMYFPAAFDADSNRLIEARVASERRLVVSEVDAVNFACNAISLGREVILHQATPALRDRLSAAGFHLTETSLTEFLKAGGSAKCLTLRLDEVSRPDTHAADTVDNRVVHLEGHLLDSGLLDRALDAAVDNGGSFRILEFRLGKQRQSPSSAEINISAPSPAMLDRITAQLVNLGASLPPGESQNVRMESVTRAGVAPEDFYSTTIYPTEVHTAGRWLRVADQRMDAVVVVAGTDGEPDARCRLIRDLNVGDRVVVGYEGLRTARQGVSRELRDGPDGQDFGFMAGTVSSERRVDVAVEQIAWEMRRIRDRGGRIVVVPGPVVIHTGGGEHLARLVRDGFVQALLGGNAIAVHDLEQNFFGTSLGVDLRRGVGVHGGHRHHLRAINWVRQCGDIPRAVEQGVLKSGIFFECARQHVPFSLAGSIRDDGPLPDTQMDLIRAQEEYARLLRGADLILMLGTMLHSIGVGNMTPAGVKLVCVDINPAVVIKLADRGSVESVGVVTDVGLFLSRLVQQLARLEPAVTAPADAQFGAGAESSC